MNLHAIAGPVVAGVNPIVPVTVKVSAGYTTDADGTQVPAYTTALNVPAQIQGLTADELKQVDSLNLEGNKRAIYFYGEVDGLVRDDNKGGDLVIFPNGKTWLVVLVLEQWDDGANNPAWCKVAVVLQSGA